MKKFNDIFGEIIDKAGKQLVFTNKGGNIYLIFEVRGTGNTHVKLHDVIVKGEEKLSKFLTSRINVSEESEAFLANVVLENNLELISVLGKTCEKTTLASLIDKVNKDLNGSHSDSFYNARRRLNIMLRDIDQDRRIKLYNDCGEYICSIGVNSYGYILCIYENLSCVNEYGKIFGVPTLHIENGEASCGISLNDLTNAILDNDIIISLPEFVSEDDMYGVITSYESVIKNAIEKGETLTIADSNDYSLFFTIKKNYKSDELVSISYTSFPSIYATLCENGMSIKHNMRIDDLIQLMLKKDFVFRFWR